jgi:hypothetical protein
MCHFTLQTNDDPALIRALYLADTLKLGRGRWRDLECVSDATDEIPAAPILTGHLNFDGVIALLEALHIQIETARVIIQQQGVGHARCLKGR